MQLDDTRGLIAALGNLAPEMQAAGRRRVAERIAAEGVVDLAAGRVYRFKHGWIPLTHAAALQQAHGNHAKAREIMARHHGAGWDRAARPKVRTSERTLATRQPASGRDKVAKGFVPQARAVEAERARRSVLHSGSVKPMDTSHGDTARTSTTADGFTVKIAPERDRPGSPVTGHNVIVTHPSRGETPIAGARLDGRHKTPEDRAKVITDAVTRARAEASTKSDTRHGPGGGAHLADPAAFDRGHVGGNSPAEMARLLTDAQLRRAAAMPNTSEGRTAKAELARRATSQAKPTSVAVPTPSYGGYGVTELRSLFAHPDTPGANRAAMAAELRRRGYTQNARTGKWTKGK